MKQTILKVNKAARSSAKKHFGALAEKVKESRARLAQEAETEKSPWVEEIQSALSPYWSARLTR